MNDEVNNPKHYGNGSIECIDYLRDNMSSEAFLGYLEGNIKKYLHRHKYKGKLVQDLEKAQWYLAELIKEQKELLNEKTSINGKRLTWTNLTGTDIKRGSGYP